MTSVVFILCALLFAAVRVSAVPPNDLCVNAQTLTAGSTFTVSTADATSTGDPPLTCGFQAGKGVWFVFTPTTCGTVTINACGSNFDTVLQVYSGGCATLTPVPNGCNDQECGPQGFQSRVSFNGTVGVSYRILAAGYTGESGTLRIVATVEQSVPINDMCSNAIELTAGATFTTCTANAMSTGDPLPECRANGGKGVWFNFLSCANGTVTVSTCGSDFDTVVQVYTGGCGSLVPVTGACNDNACGQQSSLSFNGVSGATYRIFVAGGNSASGVLRIVVTQPSATLANDFCAGAITLSDGVSVMITTACATSAGDPVTNCDFSAGKGVWFKFTPICTGTVTVSTCGSDYDSVLAVYTGTCGNLTAQVACNDDFCGYLNLNAHVSFLGTAGETYLIVASGFNGTGGPLRITAFATPSATRPDLTIDALTLNKATYLIGESGTVTVRVKNRGSTSTLVGFATDIFRQFPNAASVNCGASYYRRSNRPALAAGATDTFTIPFTAFTTAGAYWIRAFADATCAVCETNELNNQATIAFAVTAPPPDLVIQSLTLNKTIYAPGENGTVTILLRNQGSSSTSAGFVLDIYRQLANGATVNCGASYYRRHNQTALAAGSSVTMAVPFTAFATGGEFRIRAFADSTCVVDETNENNNQAAANYQVILGQPDLIMESLILNKSSYSPGEVGTATITVSNQGSSTTGIGFAVDIYRQLANGATVNCGASYYRRINRHALAAGGKDTFTVPFTAFSMAGQYLLRAFADSTCVISEANETNNQVTTNFSVSTTLTVPLSNDGTPSDAP